MTPDQKDQDPKPETEKKPTDELTDEQLGQAAGGVIAVSHERKPTESSERR